MSALTTTTMTPIESLGMLLRTLRLPAFAHYAQEVAQTAEREGWTYGRYLHHLAELEVEERSKRRIERMQRQSNLPAEKTLATLDRKRLPAKVQAALAALCEGHFLARAENVLAFGLPGRGKTHLLCAIGHHLVAQGHSVLFVPTFALVQQLLAAKRDLRLEKELAAMDRFDAVLLDDIGYVQQSREEMEVLFTFLAQRYERKSVMITSNLVFSAWDRIFKDPLTTAAAIDRLVHHATIIEMNGNSYRKEEAEAKTARRQTTTTTATAEGAATTTTITVADDAATTITTSDLNRESGQAKNGEM
jgi:DNA replication protein DnaC